MFWYRPLFMIVGARDCRQLASSTLDASAKIYAGRVDAIHTEMYKVLSGLGRGAANSQKSPGCLTCCCLSTESWLPVKPTLHEIVEFIFMQFQNLCV